MANSIGVHPNRSERRIKRAVAALGGEVEEIAWERPTSVEMVGLTGGWWVYLADERVFNGLNITEVLDNIEKGQTI